MQQTAFMMCDVSGEIKQELSVITVFFVRLNRMAIASSMTTIKYSYSVNISMTYAHLSMQIVPLPPVIKKVSPTIPSPAWLTINNAKEAISSGRDIRPEGFAPH